MVETAEPNMLIDRNISIAPTIFKFLLSKGNNKKEFYDKTTMMVLYRSPESYAVKVNNPMFQLVIHGAGPVLSPGASNEQTW